MKNIISADIMKRLEVAMTETVKDLEDRFFQHIPGMTGNAKTSAAAATYNKGVMTDMSVSGQNTDKPYPIQKRLTRGDVFGAGRIRYDGDDQRGDFKADVETTNDYIQKDNQDFLEEQAVGKDFKLSVISGTEYFKVRSWTPYQTDNYAWFKNNVSKYFQPKNS